MSIIFKPPISKLPIIVFLLTNIEYKKIKDYLRYIPDFYREILQTWIKMGGGQTKTLTHFAEIRKQLIWGNEFIMFKNKSLMFDNWINSDLIYINDILNENGEISQVWFFIYRQVP
jgi:hypothetical protein